ncbi:microfibril-associated glycoprotein 4-like [Ruditapes philippinarum]|uniref:microfibril-associated glycoprotein 4-like n=1 Tax=Ruditapes philippinarum TaxID=129788 RepID=UPI00295B30F6|nr:microfibril-associated glycoprotein 4-like [Ruditapes philippinarum]
MADGVIGHNGVHVQLRVAWECSVAQGPALIRRQVVLETTVSEITRIHNCACLHHVQMVVGVTGHTGVHVVQLVVVEYGLKQGHVPILPRRQWTICVGSNDRVEFCSKNNCETTHCATNQCVHGQCYDVLHDFICLCQPGYAGRYCNISLDNNLCDPNPCSHGTCMIDMYGLKCNCFDGYVGRKCDIMNVTDCYAIRHKNNASKSGVYNVILWRSKVVKEIYCDMDTDNGGWTVFQNRFDGSVNFTRNFKEYTNGFGNYSGEFWLGLKYIEEMAANGPSELRIDLTAADNSSAYEVYSNFHLGSSPGYALHIDPGTGIAGDAYYGLTYYNNRQPFHTFDNGYSFNCVPNYRGGWWYNFCLFANDLNGIYLKPGPSHGYLGMNYYAFKDHESLKSSKMMFRRL